jgi:hypothetical protein
MRKIAGVQVRVVCMGVNSMKCETLFCAAYGVFQRGIFKGEGVSVRVRPRTVMETRAVLCVSELAKLSALRPAKVKLA